MPRARGAVADFFAGRHGFIAIFGTRVEHAIRKAPPPEVCMNWDTVKGQWKQMKGELRTKWGKLTDDDLDVVAGDREKLEGVIQKRYGMQKDAVKRDVDTWMSTLRGRQQDAPRH